MTTQIRDALAEVILAEHEPGFANVQSSKARDALLTQFREVADAVLETFDVVAKGDAVCSCGDTYREKFMRVGQANADLLHERDTAYAEVERMMTDRNDLRAERDAALAGVEAVRAACNCAPDYLRANGHHVECHVQVLDAAPSSIPARLLSGEHVGRNVVLPDGTKGRLLEVRTFRTGGIGLCIQEDPECEVRPMLAPDDVVTLVTETENDHG